jgi:hypothetical protein
MCSISSQNRANLLILARKVLQPLPSPSNCSTWNNPLIRQHPLYEEPFRPVPISSNHLSGLPEGPDNANFYTSQ